MRTLFFFLLLVTSVAAHDLPTTDREALRKHILEEWIQKHSDPTAVADKHELENAPETAKPFLPFTNLDLRSDGEHLYVGSNGLPDHNMMIGITSWQQQVPLPQRYFDANAWRIPLKPVVAEKPALIKGRFLRGAIALAVNGIPIFNPQNNRGEISYEIGELDQWGGHCGRADDYHYHIVPLHLQAQAGQGMPVAYALDGYPIYGPVEPDGTAVAALDECHGHDSAGGYHYHASLAYPYVIGGFHGVVMEAGDQVDPQPRANPLRPALQQLRGATITDFKRTGVNGYQLNYEMNGDKRGVSYTISANGSASFTFDNGREGKTQELYQPRSDGGPGGSAEGRGKGPGQGKSPELRPPNVPPQPGGGEGPPREETGGGRESKREAFVPLADQPRSSNGTFILTSPVVEDLQNLPDEFTGDGAGLSPPVQWTGAPAGTQSYAIMMDHVIPGGDKKWYWTVYDIPADTTNLTKDSRSVGKIGTGFKGTVGYEPPRSKGPGEKTYVLTIYALSGSLDLRDTPGYEELVAAMKGKVLASSSLRVVYTSRASGVDAAASEPFAPQPSGATPPPAVGKGNGSPSGLLKPTIEDTMKLNVYADSWFMLYVNGRLVAVDPIQFTPHNVVSVDFLPEYPMTIAALAKDNADPKTGLEYANSIGDGGFILKFADGTVTNATWKSKSFSHGPVGGDTADPQIRQNPLPGNWWAIEFDDSEWSQAKEYTIAEVDPKSPYFENDFAGARFIWTENLALDNTVIFRTKIEKPDWKPRWDTKPDLDVAGVPFK